MSTTGSHNWRDASQNNSRLRPPLRFRGRNASFRRCPAPYRIALATGIGQIFSESTAARRSEQRNRRSQCPRDCPSWPRRCFFLLHLGPRSPPNPRIAPKVLVITMFGGEAKPWLDGEALGHKIPAPGLSQTYPNVACSEDRLVHDDDRHGLRQRGEFDRSARLRRAVRPDEDLFSHLGHRGRRSGPGHAWLSALGALCRRRRAAERDRPARGAGGLELGLSGDRRARRPARKSSRATATKSIASTRTCCRRPSA